MVLEPELQEYKTLDPNKGIFQQLYYLHKAGLEREQKIWSMREKYLYVMPFLRAICIQSYVKIAHQIFA